MLASVNRACERDLPADERRVIVRAEPKANRIEIIIGGQGRSAKELTNLARLGRYALRWLNRPLGGEIKGRAIK